MRIIVYKDNLSTGRGADRAVRNFAAGLAERGFEVELMEKQDFAAFLNSGKDVDVIIATGSNEIVDLDKVGYLERQNRAKVVLQLHLAPCGFFKWKHPLRNRAIRRAFNKPDVVQLLCRSYEAEFRKLAPRPKMVTIGNWTDMEGVPFRTAATQEQKTILYPAAALNKVKNQKLLIKAFSVVAKDFPEWKVRLLGKDTTRYAVQCRRLIGKLNLTGRIEIVGFTKDLAKEYVGASFVAFPSTLEGFPLAILEAAQYSLPAIVQEGLPGAMDIIKDGETGIIAKNTVVDYAAALRRLMSNPRLCRTMGENARVHCQAHYSREGVLDAWERLLGDLKE